MIHFPAFLCFACCLCYACIMSNIGNVPQRLPTDLKNCHWIPWEAVESRNSLVVQVGWKDFAYQCVIPYIKGHELPVVHDMIERITCSVICHELQYHEPPWGLVVDDVRAKRRGEHVIQPLVDRAEHTLICQRLWWLLFWCMGKPFYHGRCNRGTRANLLGRRYTWSSFHARYLRP